MFGDEPEEKLHSLKVESLTSRRRIKSSTEANLSRAEEGVPSMDDVYRFLNMLMDTNHGRIILVVTAVIGIFMLRGPSGRL